MSGPATWDGHPRCLSPLSEDVAAEAATKCSGRKPVLLMRRAGFLVLASTLLLARSHSPAVLPSLAARAEKSAMTDRPPKEGDTRKGRVFDQATGKTIREFTEEYVRLEYGKLAWRVTTLVRVRIHSGERLEILEEGEA